MSRSKWMVVCLCLTFAATAAFGANPPKRAGGPPPPVWDTTDGRPGDDMNPAVYDGPVPDVELPYYVDIAKQVIKGDTVMRIRPRSRSIAPPSANAVPGTPLHLYTHDVTPGAGLRNTESSVYTMNKDAVTATNVAYMHFDGTSWRTQIARSTNLSQWGGGSFSTTQLWLPAGYTESVDPWLAANPTTVGVRPGALYAGVLVGAQTNNRLSNPSSIRIYASDDNGATWSTGQDAVSHSATSSYLADKPHIDVSMHSATLGYLNVVWVEFGVSVNGQPAPPTRIRFRRNYGGLWIRCRPYGGACDHRWEPTSVVDSGDPNVNSGQLRIGMPQVISNPNNTELYVVYMSMAATFDTFSRLLMRRSLDGGQTWSGPITLVDSIIPTTQNYLANGVRMLPVPNAKFNHGTNQLVVTWSAQATYTGARVNDTGVYFVSFNPSTTNGLVPVRTAANETGRAEFQPAFDHDDAGNMLFTYYRTDPTMDTTYRLYGVTVSAGGLIYSPAPIGPAGAYPTPGSQVVGFIGDYHDTFYSSAGGWNRWDTGWSRVDDPDAVLTQMLSGAQ